MERPSTADLTTFDEFRLFKLKDSTKMGKVSNKIKSEICQNDKNKILAVAVLLGYIGGASGLGTETDCIVVFRVLCGALLKDLEQKGFFTNIVNNLQFSGPNSVQNQICTTTECIESALGRIYGPSAQYTDIHKLIKNTLSNI